MRPRTVTRAATNRAPARSRAASGAVRRPAQTGFPVRKMGSEKSAPPARPALGTRRPRRVIPSTLCAPHGHPCGYQPSAPPRSRAASGAVRHIAPARGIGIFSGSRLFLRRCLFRAFIARGFPDLSDPIFLTENPSALGATDTSRLVWPLSRGHRRDFLTRMIAAGALLILQRCGNVRVGRRYAVVRATCQTVLAPVSFEIGNAFAAPAGVIARVRLYAASARTAKSCTQCIRIILLGKRK